MEIDSVNQETVYLFANNFNMKQPRDMTLFTITRSVLVNESSPDKGMRMKITLKRKIMSEIMTTYFSSFLLMMIMFATTFFRPFFFEAALSVNLATMVVMTNIFISKMEGLPPTSAVKMIDYWLILCQLVPFAQVVLLTAMEYLREEELETRDVGIQSSTDDEEANESECEIPTNNRGHTTLSILILVGELKFALN